ncbi:MAG: methyltransferase domain-containing protein [Alphaproteobacteria bacterium]|nr:methyltransferase domain-containing protein [Alphaproteobacteria bacterium]
MSSEAKPLIEWRLPDMTLAVERIDVQAEIERLVARVSGPVLQIGSKASILDRQAKWRSRFPGVQFVGLDLGAGANVDAVGDISGSLPSLRRALPVPQFGFIICAHVLEHVRQPWLAAKNIAHLLKPGGHAFITVPWVQGFHGYPDDYWRMSFQGVRSLFDDFSFESEFYSGAAETVGYRLLRDGKAEHSLATLSNEGDLFQLMIEPMPAQPIIEGQPGNKLEMSRLYMPACSVNLFARKAGGR